MSLDAQIASAAVDSIGLCIFGRTVTNPNIEYITNAINAAVGSDLEASFYLEMGRETLELERQFNLAAGFGVEDDELPQFFYDEPLYPTQQTARFHGLDVFNMLD